MMDEAREMRLSACAMSAQMNDGEKPADVGEFAAGKFVVLCDNTCRDSKSKLRGVRSKNTTRWCIRLSVSMEKLSGNHGKMAAVAYNKEGDAES